MSRIGKMPVSFPEKVSISFDDKNIVTVKGPKGELTQQIDKDMELNVEDGVFTIKRPTEQKRHKALHGLYRALINNMVAGVFEGYKIELELVGVGYKATVNGSVLELALGFSHPIYLGLPEEVKAEAKTEKGKNPIVTLTSIDKQLIGQVAAKIRSLRKVEPYKGKGVRFVGENIRRKAGKAGAK